MPFFDSQGTTIHFKIDGTGPDLIMVHPWMNTLEVWYGWGLADLLREENRLILIDCRGHGESDKPHDPAMYGAWLCQDIVNLMDYMGIQTANFFGFSMGASVCSDLLMVHPERVKSMILSSFVLSDEPITKSRLRERDSVADALLADSEEDIDPIGATYRKWAALSGGDPKALGACRRGWSVNPLSELLDPEVVNERISAVSVPLMTIVGGNDYQKGNRGRMANAVRGGCHFEIEGRDHFDLLVDPRAQAVTQMFLRHINSGSPWIVAPPPDVEYMQSVREEIQSAILSKKSKQGTN